MYPMKLAAAYKDYLWGGTRLKEEFGKITGVSPLAESWEVSCHPDGPSRVANGAFQGMALREVLEKHPEMAGTKCEGEFPILIKLIDAKRDLSLQVHPDDAYAQKVEHQSGKNEMWYIVDRKPGAKIVLGLKRQITKEEFRAAIGNNTVMELVNAIPVEPGDCFCIPAGMLHAIGAGILIAEVQQSSNVTYRVYDYDRRDATGKPRELHIDKAVEVTDSSLKAVKSDFGRISVPGCDMARLSAWDYFGARRYALHGEMGAKAEKDTFQTFLCLEGALTLAHAGSKIPLIKGESIFLPAGIGDYTLNGNAVLLHTSI